MLQWVECQRVRVCVCVCGGGGAHVFFYTTQLKKKLLILTSSCVNLMSLSSDIVFFEGFDFLDLILTHVSSTYLNRWLSAVPLMVFQSSAFYLYHVEVGHNEILVRLRHSLAFVPVVLSGNGMWGEIKELRLAQLIRVLSCHWLRFFTTSIVACEQWVHIMVIGHHCFSMVQFPILELCLQSP